MTGVSLTSRLSWMVSGPARLDEMQRAIQALQQQLDVMQARQDQHLADIRASVDVVLDDVTARLAALGADGRVDDAVVESSSGVASHTAS